MDQIKPPKRRALLPASHKKQVVWQIWLPMLIAILGIIAIATLIIVLPSAGRTSINQFANVSTLFLVMPVMGIALVTVVMIGGLVYLVDLVLKKLPGLGLKAIEGLTKVKNILKAGADGAAKPFILASSGIASLKKLLELFSGKKR